MATTTKNTATVQLYSPNAETGAYNWTLHSLNGSLNSIYAYEDGEDDLTHELSEQELSDLGERIYLAVKEGRTGLITVSF